MLCSIGIIIMIVMKQHTGQCIEFNNNRFYYDRFKYTYGALKSQNPHTGLE